VFLPSGKGLPVSLYRTNKQMASASGAKVMADRARFGAWLSQARHMIGLRSLGVTFSQAAVTTVEVTFSQTKLLSLREIFSLAVDARYARSSCSSAPAML